MDFTTIAWPITGLILGLVAIFAFRAPLMRLIDRTTKVGKEGASFEHPQEGRESQTDPLSFVEIMKHPISASVLEREKTIQHLITSANLKTDQERIDLLLRTLAISRVELEFNNAAYVIFGSQLTFLIQLVGTRHGVTVQQAEAAFRQAQLSFPELHEARPYEEWFRYLQANNLIHVEGDLIDITQYGSDFLKHLVDARLAHERYG